MPLSFMFTIFYFAIGFFQLFAIVDGISYAAGIGQILSFVIAILVTYIPIVGQIFGTYGAMIVWNWEWWQAGALFFWFIPVIIVFSVYSAVFER